MMCTTTTKRYLFAMLALCLSLTAFGQSQTQARKWFVAGEYAKAKPVFAKLVKGNPKSGSLNYWYGVCLNETGEHAKALTYLMKAIDSDVENAYRYVGDYHLSDGKHEEALEYYDLYLERVDPTDTMFVVYTRRAARVKHELKFYRRVEKVMFVDSIVVPKNRFLAHYRLSHESGAIGATRELVGGNTNAEGTAYRTEMRDKIYYCDADASGRLQLFMSYKMLDNWSNPALLEGLPEGDNNYPFMLADGVTIYFANNNPNGVGGYDIYVTRYNSATDRFLVAENLGMPFNSPANDYMMVIDEINGLGWFATDRNQSDSTVCIYIFVPNETREYYDYASDDRDQIMQAARIHSIQATQTDEAALKKAQEALAGLALNTAKEKEEKAFTFIIDDFTDYHSLDDFKSPRARQLYVDWGNMQGQLRQLGEQLEAKRMQYTQSTADERRRMTDELLRMEQHYEQLETEVLAMPMHIRNAEITHIKK